MKKTMITFFISIIIVCTVIVPCAYAYESDATDIKLSVPITTNDLFVSQEEAYYIALLFIKDSIHTGLTVWDENTTIKNSVIMYDETGNDSITAYTFAEIAARQKTFRCAHAKEQGNLVRLPVWIL